MVFGGASGAGPRDLAIERWAVSGTFVLLAACLALTPLLGPVVGLLGVGVALGVLLLTILGRERTGVLLLMAAFAMAPAYKGLAPSVSTSITPMDFVLVIGIFLVAPSVFGHSLQLPAIYLAGLGIVMITGFIGTANAASPFFSFLQLLQWFSVIGLLLGFFALWKPSWKVVDLLLWSYVLGQTASLLAAFAKGPLAGTDRYMGLSHHPNAFAEGAMMAFAALLYLFHRHRGWVLRTLIVFLAAGAVEAVVLSGSRAALLVVAGLMVMVPVVERSAVAGFALALSGGIAINLLPLLTGKSGSGSALTRLSGTGDAVAADQARSSTFSTGWHMFLQHPFFGNGLDQVNVLHDLYLSAAVGGGILCLVGYLMILFVLARPLFGDHPRRRMAYLAWAFVALTPTVPALDDRTLWIPMGPVILLALIGARTEAEDSATQELAVSDPTVMEA